MVESKTLKGCACTQKLLDLLRAAKTAKKTSLIKSICAECGKTFWSNVKKECCFDCEAKKKKRMMEGAV